MRRFLFVTALAVLSAFTGPAFADNNKIGNIHIENAWARTTPPGVPNGAAYMTLMNRGKTPDRLIKVISPVAKKAEMHTHLMAGNIMRMRQVMSIDVMPGMPLTLRPGGYHIMLLGLNGPLKIGDRFPLTLIFEKNGKVKIDVEVGKKNKKSESGSDKIINHKHGHP